MSMNTAESADRAIVVEIGANLDVGIAAIHLHGAPLLIHGNFDADGSSKRHPDDIPDPSVGAALALSRALYSLADQLSASAGYPVKFVDTAALNTKIAEQDRTIREQRRRIRDLETEIELAEAPPEYEDLVHIESLIIQTEGRVKQALTSRDTDLRAEYRNRVNDDLRNTRTYLVSTMEKLESEGSVYLAKAQGLEKRLQAVTEKVLRELFGFDVPA